MAYTSEQEAKIEEIYAEKSYISVSWDKIGKLSVNEQIKGQYVDDLVNMVDIKEGLKVVIDCASGAGSGNAFVSRTNTRKHLFSLDEIFRRLLA